MNSFNRSTSTPRIARPSYRRKRPGPPSGSGKDTDRSMPRQGLFDREQAIRWFKWAEVLHSSVDSDTSPSELLSLYHGTVTPSSSAHQASSIMGFQTHVCY